MNFKRISNNFSIAKVLAILLVVTGHYFSNELPILWIPTTVALFVFAFSSGYFTSLKYRNNFEIKTFWKKKFIRLLPNLIVINIFLFVIFVYQQKTGIFTWQTIPALFGMSGILTWMDVARPSPFGHGLWFFTLLFIFYAVYPVLEKINKNTLTSNIAIISYFIIFLWLSYIVKIEHALWITAFAFCFGVYSAHNHIKILPQVSVFFISLLAVAMMFLNIKMSINYYNNFFIIFISLFSVMFICYVNLYDFLKVFMVFSSSILEIYFIHTYLFIKMENSILDFLFSVIVVLCISFILNRVRVEVINHNTVLQT